MLGGSACALPTLLGCHPAALRAATLSGRGSLRVGMSLHAPILVHRGIAPDVLFVGHQFHVRRVLTALVPTDVVDNQTVGDRAVHALPRNAVRVQGALPEHDVPPVTLAFAAQPRPAFVGASDVHAQPEMLMSARRQQMVGSDAQAVAAHRFNALPRAKRVTRKGGEDSPPRVHRRALLAMGAIERDGVSSGSGTIPDNAMHVAILAESERG